MKLTTGKSVLVALGLFFLFYPSIQALESTEVIIEKMIKAHGGMKKWKKAPTVSFKDAWYIGSSTTPSISRVMVEQNSRRAYLDFPRQNAFVSWDGEKAWIEGGEIKMPPRFVALLNYYFVNLPWLTQDPGVNLSEPKILTLFDDPTPTIAINMTFDKNVGDTPDDYYLLYIDPKTYQWKGCEYIVTYPSLLPDGKKAKPSHILLVDDYETVNDLIVPSKYTIYKKDHSVYARCDIGDWSFKKPFDESRMEMPASARLDTSLK